MAAKTVYNITELLEMILSHVPKRKQLLTLSLVDRRMYMIFRGSAHASSPLRVEEDADDTLRPVINAPPEEQLQSLSLVDRPAQSTSRRLRHTSSHLSFQIQEQRPEPMCNIDCPRLPGIPSLNNWTTFEVRECGKCIQSRCGDASWHGEISLLWKLNSYCAPRWDLKDHFSHDADLLRVVDSPLPELSMWHVWSDHLHTLTKLDNRDSASWRRVWLSPTRSAVEVHVKLVDTRWNPKRHSSDQTRDLKFFARTLLEVVAWGLSLPGHNAHESQPDVLRWRLQMFGAPREAIELLGLKDVTAWDSQRAIRRLGVLDSQCFEATRWF
ncbi:hypothetical protein Slin15195_G102780 [Septoria linicola]|uniref:F-box domain-containing protein n=1 Tax=Septoria linicola TaxID=215465 RepID=A0A9Q9AWY9_9PEZI|nr:hypothetical protein Slin14017_G065780 [Septoria linicola]USW56959.1 hypothetical protein Slin15195_G102780 [Septoria linicola]